jgi:hypothetical protein
MGGLILPHALRIGALGWSLTMIVLLALIGSCLTLILPSVTAVVVSMSSSSSARHLYKTFLG